ncbi:MAG: sigma-54 dependent transcriptional regulator [Patescibacteria group bacterium]|nr:sigma-54 dependent transcriptional regulator [Patescibacteria group bacterium]
MARYSQPIETNETGPPIPGLIGSGPAMEHVYQLTRQVARSNASVLLLGETGTGKELIAKALHRLSPRGSGPFVRVNCGALAENLLESELFGHVRGAFTGAIDNRTGRFEAAHTGTVFLDEINSTTAKLQVKLLRVLQEHEFERVGDTQTIRVDTRVIAASNRDLLEEIDAGRFREDLYYRLNVVSIYLPPLRERREDIPALVSHFLGVYNKSNDRHVPHIDRRALEAMQDYEWPGNVRELQNYVERAVVLAPGDELTVDLLPEAVLGRAPRRIGRRRAADGLLPGAGFAQNVGGAVTNGLHGSAAGRVEREVAGQIRLETLTAQLVEQGVAAAGPNPENLHASIVSRVERELISRVMAACGGVQVKAAACLGINRNTLYKKLQEHGLEK